ncbi:Purple acid phosphatase 22 [Linum perenne]
MQKKLQFFLSILFLAAANSTADDFSRPAAGKLLQTPHTGSDSDPQQVHVSLAGKDHAKVTWTVADKNAPSAVAYGTRPGNDGYYEFEARGERTEYRYFFYKSGYINHVRIGPLKPGTVYYYRVAGQYGPEFSFRMPPATLPFEFAIVGDLGQTEWTKSTLAHVNSTDYDVFILPGDLSYADSNQPLWDTFGRLVEPYATRRPWMVTHGNHEVESFPIIFPKGFKAYNARWPMPYKESGSNSNLFYSFDVASEAVHVIMLGSYAAFDAESDQYRWLENDLRKVDRKTTPWVVVVMHVPWYNTNEAHQGEGESMRKEMERVLYDARVDVVFAGHVHAYERFTRVYNNKADSCGPVYITIGDGGNREGLASSYKKPAPKLSLYREPSFGHGRLRIMDGNRAHWSWHRNNESNTVVGDEVWLDSLATKKECWNSNDESRVNNKGSDRVGVDEL